MGRKAKKTETIVLEGLERLKTLLKATSKKLPPVKLRNETVHNVNGNPLPCKLDDLGCQSISLEPYAYIRDHPVNCVLSVLKEHVNKINTNTDITQ